MQLIKLKKLLKSSKSEKQCNLIHITHTISFLNFKCALWSKQYNTAQSWTALFRAFSAHQQPSAYLTKDTPQLDKPLGQTGQTLRAIPYYLPGVGNKSCFLPFLLEKYINSVGTLSEELKHLCIKLK